MSEGVERKLRIPLLCSLLAFSQSSRNRNSRYDDNNFFFTISHLPLLCITLLFLLVFIIIIIISCFLILNSRFYDSNIALATRSVYNQIQVRLVEIHLGFFLSFFSFSLFSSSPHFEALLCQRIFFLVVNSHFGRIILIIRKIIQRTENVSSPLQQ